ncbi:MAG TPA: glycosyltransferase [Gaiellaceae bacterium]|nr:glycosyltransferase [Gaiellaceae bacterium]
MRVAREGSATGLGSFLSAASFLVPPRLDDPAGLEHAPFGCWLLGALRPATVVDLAPGSFYLALCRAAETGGADARLYAVGPAAGALARWNRPYAAFSTLLPADPVEAASGFEDESVDVLRLRGARELYAAWLPKLSRRAVLLLEGTNARDGDARDLWRELAPVQPHFEFVHGGGLGVVAAGEAPEELRALLELDEGGGAGLVRLAYERLGSALRDRGTAERSDPDASARAARLEAELQWAYDNLVARAEDAGRLHDRLVEIESSTTWRLTQRPRAFLARHETLRRLLRLALGSAWRALRRAARRRRRGEAAFDPDVGYERWVALYDTLGKGERLAMAAHARALESQPLISVLLPVCDPPAELLRAAIESVRDQVYDRWELCVADDASRSPAVHELLEEAAADPRVKVVRRERRGGIAAASNDAAALATGDYVGLLDHDDVLRPHALLLVADELARHPDAVLVYSDEDKLDADGNRCEHHFKPDWNPALILCQNYVAHFTVVRRERLVEVGGFRSEYDGSQDWDLVLRATEGQPPERIRHVPHVLYHWRKTERSTAQRGEAKPEAVDAGRRAVEDALARAGASATVSTVHGAYQRVRYAVPSPAPRVDVVMPTACKLELLEPCLEGLLSKTAYDGLRVTLVVSSIRFEVPAQARFLERIREDERVRLHVYEDRPFNYSWLNNTAAAELDAPLLLLMNDDMLVIQEDWLEVMVGHALQDRVGAVGAKLYYPTEQIQHAGVIVGGGGIAAHNHQHLPRPDPGYHARAWLSQDLSCVTAAVTLLRREAFEQVGGFDEQLAVAFNDVDLCLRLVDAGWRVVWTPDAELYHRESVSVGRHNSPERREEFEYEERLMVRRWGERLLADPHYNPNLSLRDLNRPSFPPRVDYPWRRGLPGREAEGRRSR